MTIMSSDIQENKFNEKISEYSGVFVIAEQRFSTVMPVSFELIGEGKRLAEKLQTLLYVIVLGYDMDENVKILQRYGVDYVIYADHPRLEHYNLEPYSFVITDLIDQHKPEIVIIGASSIGRELAPTLSSRLKTGLTADCTHLEIDVESGNLLQTRPAFGGNLMATIQTANHRPQMCTVRPGVMPTPLFDKFCKISGEITKFSPNLDLFEEKVKILNIKKEKATEVDLMNASIIVAGGRGLGSSKGFELLQQLAKKLNGNIASSRACVDNGWISKNYQVGQTGKTVRPKLYIACGISGAIQHIAGIAEADCIIAINRDPDAAIFSIANYGIVGDLYQVIPQFLKQLELYEEEQRTLLCEEGQIMKHLISS